MSNETLIIVTIVLYWITPRLCRIVHMWTEK